MEIKFEGQYENIPRALQGGIRRYLENRICPGSFLSAVIKNDLSSAIARADLNSLRELKNIVQWLYWNAPSVSWGSPEKMKAWLAGDENND